MTEFLKVEMDRLEGFIRGRIIVGEVGSGIPKVAGVVTLSPQGWAMLSNAIGSGISNMTSDFGKSSVEVRTEE